MQLGALGSESLGPVWFGSESFFRLLYVDLNWRGQADFG